MVLHLQNSDDLNVLKNFIDSKGSQQTQDGSYELNLQQWVDFVKDSNSSLPMPGEDWCALSLLLTILIQYILTLIFCHRGATTTSPDVTERAINLVNTFEDESMDNP